MAAKTRLGYAGYGIRRAGSFASKQSDNSWYVRYLGNDANGGGFDATLGGVNYADQDSPQWIVNSTNGWDGTNTFAFLLNSGAATPAITSAIKGNYFHCTGGTNAIVGLYKIIQYAPSDAGSCSLTLDRCCVTGGSDSTDITGYIGGAFATPAAAPTLSGVYGGPIVNDVPTWYARNGGSNLNGGGYYPGLGGTSYADQDAAHVTLDGVTIAAHAAGVTSTVIVTGYTVATGDKGNFVNIASGTGFIAGTYLIVSVNVGSATWTLDRNCTSGVASGAVGKMGGGLHTVAACNTQVSTFGGTITDETISVITGTGA